MQNLKQNVSDSEKSEGNAQSGERQIQQQITGMVRDYLECLDTVWDTDPQTRAREYSKLGMLIRYQLALFSPTPVAFSLMERNIKAGNTEAGEASWIYLSPELKEKVELAGKQLKLSPNEAVVAVLTEHIDEYLDVADV